MSGEEKKRERKREKERETDHFLCVCVCVVLCNSYIHACTGICACRRTHIKSYDSKYTHL